MPGAAIDETLRRHGQPLTESVLAWMHASAPGGRIVLVHDILGRWPGHEQPFGIEEALELARRDPAAALALAESGDVPIGCDPREAARRLGAHVIDTRFWRWPFAPAVDYLVCATVVAVPYPHDRTDVRLAEHATPG
jgi:hypothetical protein